MFFFVCHLCLEYLSSDESDESNKEEYDELGYKSGSAVTIITRLCWLLHGAGLPFGVTLSSDDSCNDQGSLSVP